MIDTLTTAVKPAVASVEASIPLILSTTGLGGLIGKIVWDWLKSPQRTMCSQHNSLNNDISQLKTDVAVVKNNVEWLIEFHKKGIK